MTTPARLAVLCSLALAASASAQTADSSSSAPTPAPVVEHAPEGSDAANELASLRTENQRLAEELQSTTQSRQHLEAELAALARAKTQDESALTESARELAQLRAKVARLESVAPTATQQQTAAAAQTKIDQLATKNRELEVALGSRTAELRDAQTVFSATKAAEEAARTQAATEKARADEVQARLSTMMGGIDRLLAENSVLESQLTQLRTTETGLREQLAAAQKSSSAPSPDLSAKLAETEAKLAEAEKSLTSLRAENTLLKKASEDQTWLTAELATLREEKAARDAAPAATAEPSPELTAKVAELEEKLSTALRSYSLLQTENDQLKAAGAERSAAADELAALRREKADLEAQLAATPPPAPDRSAELAEIQDKLNTVLRSYSLLQEETDRIKADAAHSAEQASAASTKSAGESAAQITALFDELRQTQAQAAALAAENSQLKFRLGASGPVPGSTMATPSRPSSVAPAAPAASAAAPAPDTPTPAAPAVAAPGPRTHVVTAGDSLTKISRNYYGTANRWDEILNANRDVIRNENVLPLGVTLRIP
jgi:nucleoid-associated protein YgaU